MNRSGGKVADTFRAFRAHQDGKKIKCGVDKLTLDDLNPGEVIIQTEYSSVNYKDALGGSGQPGIYKKYPIVCGIDGAGVVESSSDKRFKSGDSVLITGCEFGERVDGGYSEKIRVDANRVIPLPKNLTTQEAMIYGTAGFTAALCLYRMEKNGQTPQKGPIIVTGASGGVGCFAIQFLKSKGYEVIAVSGKSDQKDFLVSLGASQVISPEQLELGSRPLEKARWAGAIDNVGGELLAGLVRHIDLWGNVATVGLAGGIQLNTTVMPYILRGVSLLGISSNNCEWDVRLKTWERMASTLKPKELNHFVSQQVTVEELPAVFQNMLDRKTHGRVIVKF
jgi:acrylyl-CoA reductase (NADPH)